MTWEICCHKDTGERNGQYIRIKMTFYFVYPNDWFLREKKAKGNELVQHPRCNFGKCEKKRVDNRKIIDLYEEGL